LILGNPITFASSSLADVYLSAISIILFPPLLLAL